MGVGMSNEDSAGVNLFLQSSYSRFEAIRATPTQVPQSWITIDWKTYPRLKRVSLPSILDRTDISLRQAILRRRSTREFSTTSISLDEVSELLKYSAGVSLTSPNLDETRRTYPSAGARYPVEIYPIVLNCNGMDASLYHYNVIDHALELLDIASKEIINELFGDSWIGEGAIIFLLSSVFHRSSVKYQERSYRFALIEAGHIIQNFCLMATALGLGSCTVGGFFDYEMNQWLALDFPQEIVVCAVVVGHFR